MAANEESRLTLEEKVANDEHQCLVEEEKRLFFIDTFTMDERQKEYINLTRNKVLAKQILATNMNAPSAGYESTGAPAGVFGGGYGGMGAPKSVFGRGMHAWKH
jgi:hypothetical protein